MGCLSSKEGSDSPNSLHHYGREGQEPVSSTNQPHAEEHEQMWYYIDLAKVLQGPFVTSQMKLWLDQGYLPDDLEVRTASEANFSLLRHRKHEIDPSFEQEFPLSQSHSSNAPPSQGGAGGLAPTVPDTSNYSGMDGPQQESLEGRRRAVVLYPYQAQRNDELTIKRADVVTIVYEGRNWCEVRRKGLSGKVPGNYIEKIMPTEKVIAMYDYTPDGLPSCLTFKKGEIIEVVEKQTDGWWKGIHQECLGAFPSSFVQPA